MRVNSLRAVFTFVCVLWGVSAFAAAEAAGPTAESYATTLAKSAGSSIASAGGLAVAKALTGQFYDATCAKEAVKDKAEQYFCAALASFSGRSDDEWKAEVKKQLTEIQSKLDTLEKGQKELQFDLSQHHKEMYELLKQTAAEQIATSSEVDFATLWKKYMRLFASDADVDPNARVKFAKKILGEKLDDKLSRYSTVLVSSFRGNQGLLRYPFYAYRTKYEFRESTFNHNASFQGPYDAAEKAFLDARAQQEKVVLMVLWAIKTLEVECEQTTPCERPQLTSKEFMKEVDADTKDQLIAYNEALDWLLLAYGYPERDAWFLPPYADSFLTRANAANAAVMAAAKPTETAKEAAKQARLGAWGRVISMGDAWDGTINVECGSSGGTLKPLFSYTVPVDGPKKLTETDWWISRAGNDVYDEAHFARQWKVYHYWIPNAADGPCKLSRTLPGKGVIPWVQPGTKVMTVHPGPGISAVFGSFIGIQRAGGWYAMGSGNQWRAPREPFKSDEGTTAVIEKRQDEWSIDPSGPFPKVGFLFAGRGEYKVRLSGSGGRVHKINRVYLYSEKKIYFPDDRNVKLELAQGSDCAKACGPWGAPGFIVDYNIENGGTGEKEKGKLTSVVSVFLDPRVAPVDSPNVNGNIRDIARGRGVYIDGSYGPTSERKTQEVKNFAEGSLTTEPSAGYHLQYLMDFDLETEGNGIGATEWKYRSKITPSGVYLKK